VLRQCYMLFTLNPSKLDLHFPILSRTLSFNFQDFPGSNWFPRTFQDLENPGKFFTAFQDAYCMGILLQWDSLFTAQMPYHSALPLSWPIVSMINTVRNLHNNNDCSHIWSWITYKVTILTIYLKISQRAMPEELQLLPWANWHLRNYHIR